MHRQLPPDEPIGESWEVSDHQHGKSVVANGQECGKTLDELIATDGEALLGSRVTAKYATNFPLLVKYIDAGDKLSVQVHPDDAYAATHAGELGKTEMWYVLFAEPGACLIAGLREGVTREELEAALRQGDPADLLHSIPVKAGDSLFIPAGRIHAIMAGLLILEIQQNSDTTYRLYDWGRLGLDGKPRELHIDQALAVINWSDHAPKPKAERTELNGADRITRLASCPYFVVDKYNLASERVFNTDGGSFHIINCVAGDGSLNWYGGVENLSFGDSLLIPAGLQAFSIQPNGEVAVVVSYVP